MSDPSICEFLTGKDNIEVNLWPPSYLLFFSFEFFKNNHEFPSSNTALETTVRQAGAYQRGAKSAWKAADAQLSNCNSICNG